MSKVGETGTAATVGDRITGTDLAFFCAPVRNWLDSDKWKNRPPRLTLNSISILTHGCY